MFGDFIEAVYDTLVSGVKNIALGVAGLLGWAVTTLVLMFPLSLVYKFWWFPEEPYWLCFQMSSCLAFAPAIFLFVGIVTRLENKKEEVERKVIEGEDLHKKIIGR